MQNSMPSVTAGVGNFLDPQTIAAGLGVTEGMKIADFGSGAGFFAVILAQMVGESGLVTAVDVMENDLESVRSKAKTAGVNNIQTVRSDLEVVGSSGIEDNSQDLVLLANILFQSQKKLNILQESYRVLKENGKLILIDWRKGMGGGPPEEFRTDEDVMRSLVLSLNFVFERSIDAGMFHYGFVFSKVN